MMFMKNYKTRNIKLHDSKKTLPRKIKLMSFLTDVLAFTSKKYLDFLTLKTIIFISEGMIHVKLERKKRGLF